MCDTCLTLLDAVVAEWSTEPLEGTAACATCGRPARSFARPSPLPPRDVQVDVDGSGPALAVRVSGPLDTDGVEIVALEVAWGAAPGAPVAVDLRDALLVRPVTLGSFIRRVRDATLRGSPVGIVIQPGRVSQFAADLVRRAGWVAGDTERSVVDLLRGSREVRLR